MNENNQQAGFIDTQIRVRYAEVDQMGALHHSRYWVYFEMGRTELLRQQGFTYADLEKADVLFVVANCQAKFRQPARYDDLLTLRTKIDHAGTARLDHSYELRRTSDDALICTATTTLACVNRLGEIIPMPAHIREVIPADLFKRKRARK